MGGVAYVDKRELEKLRAEIERLRAALQKIVDHQIVNSPDYIPMRTIAVNALADQGKG